jgi:predicted amidohydrolase
VPGGPTLAAWEAAARRLGVHVVGGLIESDVARLFNTAVLVGPGGYIGRYRKAHLFAMEKGLFEPGDEGFPVFDTDLGRLGLLICFDLRFPEAPRALALGGAEVLCVPTTWTNLYKPIPWDERGYCMANYLAKAHAYLNRCYVACADRIGDEAGITYLGSSLIVDPSGEVVAGPASRDQEEILVAEVNLSRARSKALGDENDLVNDRRPEFYQLLTSRQ